MSTILPGPIAEELFELDHTPSEMCIGYITEVIEHYHFTADDAVHTGVVCCIKFRNDALDSELYIDRSTQQFTIMARTKDGGMYMPQTGTWATVIGYLKILSREK